MPNPINVHGAQTGQPLGPAGKSASTGPVETADGRSFKDLLMDSLDQVNRLQQEAAAGVEKVVTGETDNIAEVFSAVRKSDVAFSMLMEMRNKLVEAFREVQQMRV
jgi:flagellar hook-basal body complex protein FliE